ncbi:hypothetical protein CPB84DRAFT_1828312 [Gymnopilus junonius]|uniref:Uncharacterized protein n=1 Tax=Gymnopilus junonius TaxID=109634 RepID=A0A9P5NEH3_GYMJU|nr:hypothetical protein CPB84DRAFT_1828312 [Gymnopilus junonius]
MEIPQQQLSSNNFFLDAEGVEMDGVKISSIVGNYYNNPECHGSLQDSAPPDSLRGGSNFFLGSKKIQMRKTEIFSVIGDVHGLPLSKDNSECTVINTEANGSNEQDTHNNQLVEGDSANLGMDLHLTCDSAYAWDIFDGLEGSQPRDNRAKENRPQSGVAVRERNANNRDESEGNLGAGSNWKMTADKSVIIVT